MWSSGAALTAAVVVVAGILNSSGFSGGAATLAKLNAPSALAVGQDGSLYIGDTMNFRVRAVGHDGSHGREPSACTAGCRR